MRRIVLLLVLALSLSSCVKHSGEAWAGASWVVKNPAEADGFFDGLKVKLATEGFALSEPMVGFLATAGITPNGRGQVYWFKGSYQGSPVFYIKLVQDGPHRECIHLMYYWDLVAYSNLNKEMEGKMHSLNASLTDWVKMKGDLVYLPPGVER